MRHSPQSPTGSPMSSCSASPGPLYTNWRQSKPTERSTPSRPHLDNNNTNNSNNNNNNNNDDYVDDDIFGSAQFRKKRGPKRSSKTENGEDKEPAKNIKRWSLIRVLQQRTEELRSGVGVVGRWVGAVWTWVPSPASASASASAVAGTEVPVVDLDWKPVPEPGSYELTNEVLVQQARLLCGNYIYHRLSSKGLMSKRVHVAPYHSLLSEELSSAGQELERLYPRVYSDISRRIAVTMSSAQLVRRLLTSVLEGTFKAGVTWAKVVSMVVIAAAFAEECVVQGHPNFVEDVVMCVGHFVMLHLASWLAKQGGWAAFPTSRPPVLVRSSQKSPMKLNTTLTLLVVAIFVIGIYKLFWCST